MKNLTNFLKAVEAGVDLHLVLPRGKFASTNQKHYPDLGSASSACNFSTCFSDIISRKTSGES